MSVLKQLIVCAFTNANTHIHIDRGRAEAHREREAGADQRAGRSVSGETHEVLAIKQQT